MSGISRAPQAVRDWFDAQQSDDYGQLRTALSPDIVFDFAGRKAIGIDAVLTQVSSMPKGLLGHVEWSLLPGADAATVTVRGTGPDSAPLPSPGGPMSAMDFTFTLDDMGRIAAVRPHPHHTEPRDLAQPLAPGQPAPTFVLPDLSGQHVSLEEPTARATVVVFTCNPCPWALGWHDRIQQVTKDYQPQGVRVLQINANDPTVSPKDAARYSQERCDQGEFAGPYLVDAGQTTARRWGARHTPDVFVLDAAGVVRYHGAPDADVDDDTLNATWLRSAIDDVLAGRTVALATTEPIGCTIKWTL